MILLVLDRTCEYKRKSLPYYLTFFYRRKCHREQGYLCWYPPRGHVQKPEAPTGLSACRNKQTLNAWRDLRGLQVTGSCGLRHTEYTCWAILNDLGSIPMLPLHTVLAALDSLGIATERGEATEGTGDSDDGRALCLVCY